MQRLFEKHNEELYNLIEQYPGPSMEQHPFPKFNYRIKDCWWRSYRDPNEKHCNVENIEQSNNQSNKNFFI